jgi:hypothetical protein
LLSKREDKAAPFEFDRLASRSGFSAISTTDTERNCQMSMSTGARLVREGKNISGWITVLITVTQLLVSLVALGTTFLFSLNTGPCSSATCNAPVGEALVFVTPVGVIVALGWSITGGVVRHRKRRSSWWVPALGASFVILCSTVQILLNVFALAN